MCHFEATASSRDLCQIPMSRNGLSPISSVTSGVSTMLGVFSPQPCCRHSSPVRASMCTALLESTEPHLQLGSCMQCSLEEDWRTVEPVLLTENRNRQLATWLRSLTTRHSLPPCRVRLPVRFLCSKIGGGAWHAEGRTDDEEAVQPACRWKQAPSATKASFAGGVIRAVSIHEAVVYGRPWCKQCITFLPGRLQADLDTFAIEFK